MKRFYKDFDIEIDVPKGFYLINPKKYSELNLKSIDQMNLIDAFVLKMEDKIANLISFYECEDFEFDKVNFDISIQKINDNYASQINNEDIIMVKQCFDCDFNQKKGLVVILSQKDNTETSIMQLYFEYKEKAYCFSMYYQGLPDSFEEIEKSSIFAIMKGIIDEI